VSKAATKSSIMRTKRQPKSADIRRSLVIFTNAVSVPWPDRKPD